MVLCSFYSSKLLFVQWHERIYLLDSLIFHLLVTFQKSAVSDMFNCDFIICNVLAYMQYLFSVIIANDFVIFAAVTCYAWNMSIISVDLAFRKFNCNIPCCLFYITNTFCRSCVICILTACLKEASLVVNILRGQSEWWYIHQKHSVKGIITDQCSEHTQTHNRLIALPVPLVIGKMEECAKGHRTLNRFISAIHEHDNDTCRHTQKRAREVTIYKYSRLAKLDSS